MQRIMNNNTQMNWHNKNKDRYIYIHARKKILNVSWHDCLVPECEPYFILKISFLEMYIFLTADQTSTFVLQTEGA